MTPEAQNIAIAKLLGWTGIIYVEATDNWAGNKPGGGRFRFPIPKYTASLDACAEFEAMLADSDDGHGSRWRYIQELIEVTGAECMEIHRNVFTVVHATAPQRCEAYLRTIGKWTASTQQPA